MNIYFCITKEAFEDETGARSYPCELVAAETANKAKYLTHKHNDTPLDYSFEYIDWRAEIVAKAVDYKAGVLPANTTAWDDYFCPECDEPLLKCQCQNIVTKGE